MKKVCALVLALALCLALFPAALAEGEAPKTYDEAVAELRSGTGHSNEKTFETDQCTVFSYDRGGFMNAPVGALTVIYKAGSAMGEGTVVNLPHITSRLLYNGRPTTLALSEDKKTFTYTYFFPEAVASEAVYGANFKAGTYTYTVDLATGTTTDSYAGLDYATALDQLTRAEDYIIDEQVETPYSTVVTRHKAKTWWVREAGKDLPFNDYEMYLVLRTVGERTVQRLLLPSTVYNMGYGYAPTDRLPDSVICDGKAFVYTYSFDAPLINGDTVYHEAGTYTYIVNAATGEQSVIHSDEIRSPAQPPAEAPEEAPIRFFAQSQELAEKLKALGLFLGDENGSFNLDWGLTRTTALIMLIRALGEEQQAKAAGKTHPFTDVPAWADGYVSWAYAKGYTNGVSATQFGANNTAGADMYLTFMLRALGYSDKDGEDFTWNSPYLTAREAGILPFETNCLNFTRADAVLVTSAALFAPEKNFRFQSLHEQLEQGGAFTAEQFKAAFPEDPFAWETTVERKVDSALDKALGVGQADFKTARVQSHAILDVAQDGVLLTIHALVCDHSLTAEELRDGEFGDYFTCLYVIEMQKAANTPGTVLRCERDWETVSYWDDPTVVLFRDELDAVAQKKMTDLISSGVVQFRKPTYDEAVEDFLNSTSLLTVKETFESDYGTVFVWDVPNPNANTGMMEFICKAGHPKGEGTVISLPHPQHGMFNMVRPAASMELSEDKKTFTYSYHFDEPLVGSGRIIRAAGDFIYTLDLTTGEITENVPTVDESVNTYAACLERTLADYAERGYVVEQTIEAPLCTLIFSYSPAENGTRSYFLELVYKTDVDADVSGSIQHTDEGMVKSVGLPITINDGDRVSGLPAYYTSRMPDSMALSEDGNTFSLTYNECHYGSPYTQTIDLKTGICEGK